MTTPFNFQTFFNYYIDPNNVNQEPLPRPTIQFFHGSRVPHDASLGDTSVNINGNKYYIKVYPHVPGKTLSGGLQFTRPTVFHDASGIWDTHYHFGVRDIDVKVPHNKKGKRKITTKIRVIYFHKTVQRPGIKEKRHINCFFLDNQSIDPITIIPDIECKQTEKTTMKDLFPLGTEDLAVIGELIRRPFYGAHYGGKRYRNATTNKRRSKNRARTHKN